MSRIRGTTTASGASPGRWSSRSWCSGRRADPGESVHHEAHARGHRGPGAFALVGPVSGGSGVSAHRHRHRPAAEEHPRSRSVAGAVKASAEHAFGSRVCILTDTGDPRRAGKAGEVLAGRGHSTRVIDGMDDMSPVEGAPLGGRGRRRDVVEAWKRRPSSHHHRAGLRDDGHRPGAASGRAVRVLPGHEGRSRGARRRGEDPAPGPGRRPGLPRPRLRHRPARQHGGASTRTKRRASCARGERRWRRSRCGSATPTRCCAGPSGRSAATCATCAT